MQKLKVDLPKNSRVESGSVQFNNDWPGLFLRGDDCFGFSMVMEKELQDNKNLSQSAKDVMEWFVNKVRNEVIVK